MLYVKSLNTALHEMMSKDRQVILIGEDILDPYGGAFKVSKGLSTRFPKQVISTPISEQSITGAAIGMAMRGMKPVVEIMFGDFITLCTEQIVNQATKYPWIFNGQVTVPIVIRTPMGGGRGYGPAHSQTLENLFMPVPNLRIVAPSLFHNPGEMLKKCVFEFEKPVLFIENKISYPKEIIVGEKFKNLNINRIKSNNHFDIVHLSMFLDEQPDVLILTYGGMSEIAANVSIELFMEEEILVKVIVLGDVKPFPLEAIIPTIIASGRVLVLEEGHVTGGWGTEVAYQIQQNAFTSLKKPVRCHGAKDFPIPSSILMEKEVLPTIASIKKNIMKLLK